MIELKPSRLTGHGVLLEPLSVDHTAGLRMAAADGELWRLLFAFVPKPEAVPGYVREALADQVSGNTLPWVVRDSASGEIIGTTRYHDVLPQVDRLEIGYTWYRPAWQRTHVNTACKLLLLRYAFEALGCGVVGFRTDGMNLRSQRAIEALGASRDGRLRSHSLRRDGSVRDDVMYSILATEWHGVRRHLETRLWRHAR
jgi:RimJ/RimL family protein N-acetyltransferase